MKISDASDILERLERCKIKLENEIYDVKRDV